MHQVRMVPMPWMSPNSKFNLLPDDKLQAFTPCPPPPRGQLGTNYLRIRILAYGVLGWMFSVTGMVCMEWIPVQRQTKSPDINKPHNIEIAHVVVSIDVL